MLHLRSHLNIYPYETCFILGLTYTYVHMPHHLQSKYASWPETKSLGGNHQESPWKGGISSRSSFSRQTLDTICICRNVQHIINLSLDSDQQRKCPWVFQICLPLQVFIDHLMPLKSVTSSREPGMGTCFQSELLTSPWSFKSSSSCSIWQSLASVSDMECFFLSFMAIFSSRNFESK